MDRLRFIPSLFWVKFFFQGQVSACPYFSLNNKNKVMKDKFFDSYGQEVWDGAAIVIEEHVVFKGHDGERMYAMFDVLRGRWVYDRRRMSSLLDTAFTFEGVESFKVDPR